MAGAAMAESIALKDPTTTDNPLEYPPGTSHSLDVIFGDLSETTTYDLTYSATAKIIEPGYTSSRTADSDEVLVTFIRPKFAPTVSNLKDPGVCLVTLGDETKVPVGSRISVMVSASGTGTEDPLTYDISLTATKTITAVPEFPTVALPVAAILGLVFIFGRKKEGL